MFSHVHRHSTIPVPDQCPKEVRSSFGAEIRINARVSKLIVRDGRVHGAVLDNGDEVHAPLVVTTLHPKFGELRMQNVAPKLSATPGGIRLPAPELGQHTDEILGSLLDFSADRLAALHAQGVI